ncbi:AEL169Wp [Eremothecium gossypii ATCC 10895]|uniref:Succinate dehydrogenase assembly factor 4, mitochondrial n=1 Tax=Eremothecium gossypii (strain ATCC 10895 / CBS 109.51 / FGSC 9923 / NRRL Y-1056) TaxID=284811 RepID=Q758C1_EREGS|nr:AEL169Wp [Eremothecium gossypii ATCC 10895]AAS52516.1 AEL169Wp [Eremothecium gossypii ATCC 10895]
MFRSVLRHSYAVPTVNYTWSSRSLIRFFTSDEKAAPPSLPREEQKEFERLQKIAQSQAAIDEYNRQFENDHTKESANSPILKTEIGSFSPEFSKTLPEFEGDKNPETGEIGGPRQDPLRYGDYSYNGRVTDF